MSRSIFKYPVLIGYMIKKIGEKYPGKQVGKTFVQKIFYLLTRQEAVDFNYSMYHYGPYSSEVSGELNFAESSGIVNVEWIEDKGYFINSTSKLDNFKSLLKNEEIQAIDDIIETYADFNTIELSLIATALYSRDNFEVSDERLAEVVHNAKPNFSLDLIERVLQKAGI